MFGPHCERGLNSQKFHPLDHVVDGLESLGTY